MRRPRIPLLPDILLAAVESDPSASALSFEGTDLSYAEVDAWSSRLARALIGRGLGADDVVAVAMKRSASSVRSVWGIAKSGATFLPVDPNYPADRIDHMLTDSGARFGVTVSEFVDALPKTVDWLVLDDPASVAELGGNDDSPVMAADRVRPLHATHGCYMIYTSGSTGVPKGVVVTHAGLSDLAVELRELYSLTSSSRTLHFASPSFDASVFELLMAVTASSTMVVAPPSVYGGMELAELLREERVTHAVITPAALASVDPAGLVDLEMVLSAGEACPPELVSKWAVDRPAGRRRFFNGYGPTEATIMATCSSALDPGATVSIGGPIRGMSAAVLDDRLRPAIAGSKGELYLWGAALARGYHGKEALTADRFVANPFANDGSRMYRTGDIVRWRHSSKVLEYSGRSDFQVKIRGFRIELGEIDSALTAHSGVDFAVTVAREGVGGAAGAGAESGGGAGSAMLVSYVLAVEGVALSTADLTQFVADTLPRHMVPTTIVLIDELPLTPVGKLDRAALPDPVLLAREFRAPESPTQRVVAGVFSELLDLPRVGLDDDFFELGGNSLIATQVVARIGAALDTTISVRSLFDYSSVVRFAESVDAQNNVGHRTPLTARSRPEPIPLSLAQRRMWFMNRLEPESAINNLPLAVRLTGELNTAALSQAVFDVVNRHETLRTYYPEKNGDGHQVVLDAVDVAPRLVPVPVADSETVGVLQAMTLAPFDLTTEVPLRAQLLAIGDGDYVLALVTHHITADGASLAPLTRDLMTAYVSRAAGIEPAWTPLRVQYTDYTLWQHEVLGSSDDPTSQIAVQESFWKSELEGIPSQLDLPTDRPRPSVQSSAGGTVDFEISGTTHRALLELAKSKNATFFMVAHAALAVLLARLSNVDDVVIGAPIAGRGDEQLDDLVGMFVNTLPLRTRLDPTEPFVDLLGRVQESDLQAFGHDAVPFERLVEVLDPERSPSRHPIFQVAIFLQNMTQQGLELPSLAVTPVPMDGALAKFDLQFTLAGADTRHGDGGPIAAQITYATALFDEKTVQSLARRYCRILDAIAADPVDLVGELDLLGDAERQMLLRDWNDTHHALTGESNLLSKFDDRVVSHPDQIAVIFEDRSLTYQEFDSRVDSLARALIARGIGPEARVAVAIRRSLDLVVGIYAVLRAGAAFVPVDPDHPESRVRYIVEAAGPACVLVSGDHDRELFGDVAILDVTEVDTVSGERSATVTDSDRVATLTPDNTAYVIFTSGSTGKPKGVAVSHRAVVNQMAWMRTEYDLTAADVYLQKTATTFDVSLWGFFLPLQVGASLVLATPDGHRDPAYIADTIAEHSVTLTDFVPSMLTTFTAHASGLSCRSLRHVFVIGEAFPLETANAFRAISSAGLHNLYGPTEAAVSVTYWESTASDSGTVPIGRPEWNTAAVVLDSQLRIVPAGTAGELYLSGVQLARGYLGRPDLTFDRFVADPTGTPGTRMYRTGDLARWRLSKNGEPGILEYIGRTDFQVKFRGQRIELGEIETALLAHPTINQAVVLVVTVASSDHLVAYVVPRPGTSVDVASVRTDLGRLLPTYMVPAAVVVLDAFPLNSSGKLDRKALPEPTFETREFRAPTTPVEEIVASTFAEVLRIDRVGLDDDFFSLGGNSLIATRVVARLGEALDSRVPVRSLFEASGVETLAARLESSVGSGARAQLTRQVRPERIPLSLAQQRMWFLNQLDSSSAAYNLPVAIRLRGDLDVMALCTALEDVVDRHESLRTVYPSIDGQPHQNILSGADATVGFTPETVSESDLGDRLIGLFGRGFDVSIEIPLRAELFVVGEDDHVLAVVVHHISSDGYSMGPLARDVMSAYVARASGESPNWAPLAVQYADYALWQRASLGKETDPGSLAEVQLSYWAEKLSGIATEIELPKDRPRPTVASNTGRTVTITLDGRRIEALDVLARENNSSRFMAVHTILAVLLARLSGTDDIAIGTPVAGRGDASLDDVIGMFVNTLVLRTELDLGADFPTLLAATREVDLEAFAHADIPFERVVDVVAPERSQARHPLFQVMLAFQNMERRTFELPQLAVTPVDLDFEIAKFDLQVTVLESGGAGGSPQGMTVQFAYAVDLFDHQTVVSFADRFLRLLSGILAQPKSAVGDVDVFGPGERDLVLRQWSGSSVAPIPQPEHRTLAARFDDQVAAAPMAQALVYEDERLSYEELAMRANRLARLLIAHGVGPETLVAVVMPRSVDLVVAVLAVIASGAGYVPIDPSYPQERIDYVLEDSAPAVVLTWSGREARLGGSASVLDVDTLDLNAMSGTAVGDHDRTATLRPSDVAYVIYTSGSTGLPKGVAVPHDAVGRLLDGTDSLFSFDSADTWTLFHSYAFDFSVWELWGPLLHGGTLVVVDYFTSRSPDLFRQMLIRENVTVLNQTPSAFHQLAEIDRMEGGTALSALRYIVFGGEPLELRRLTPWFDRYGDRAPRLVNMYGITETTVHVSHRELDSALVASASGSVVGGAIPGLRIHILDTRLAPVPPGVAGELYIGGDQVARGYLGRHSLTATRFIADPFSASGVRLYRSGDVARWNGAGELEFVGRADDQVKIRGFRIELGEIESVILELDRVAQVAVVAREDIPGTTRLVAYVVPGNGVVIDDEDLRSQVSAAVPEYMVPAAFVILESIPLTVNGKLDRRALPAPMVRRNDFQAPRTDAERIVGEVFADVLGVERVGVDDSFFALGGDSIMSIQVVSRVKSRGLSITARNIFEHKTVAAIAENATAVDGVDSPGVLDEMPGGGVGPIPATPMVAQMLERGTDLGRYTQNLVLELPLGIDTDGVTATIQAVVDHHDVLRSSLVATAELGSVHYVAERGSVDAATLLHRVEVDEAVGPDDLRELALIETNRAMDRLDPWNGAVLQFVWLDPVSVECRASRTGRLVVVAHHLVVDGVSWRIFVPDLVKAWIAVSSGQAPALEPVGTSFRRWAHGLRDAAASDKRRNELDYWESVLSGPDAMLGSRPFDSTVDVASSVDRVEFEVPASVTDAVLTTIPRLFHGSVNDGLLATFMVALNQWRRERGGAEDRSALIRFEGHGREEEAVPGADLSRTVGWFTSIYPVRFDLDEIDLDDALAGGPHLGRAIKLVKEALRAVPDRGIGFGQLRYLNPESAARLASQSVGQIVFNYLGRVGQETVPTEFNGIGWLPAGDLGDLAGDPEPTMPAMATLDINSVVIGDRLSGSIAFPSGLLAADDVRHLTDLWVGALGLLDDYSRSDAVGGHTPSDFDLVRTSSADIARWEAGYRTVTDVWPLTPLQAGMYFLGGLDDSISADAYTVQISLDLGGHVDAERLHSAARTLLERHPNLRTAFVDDESGTPVQIVVDGLAPEWTEIDLTAEPLDAVAARADRIMADDKLRRFDLAAPPLLRFTLIRRHSEPEGTTATLVVTNHHVLLDGWSMPLLMQELIVLYAMGAESEHLPRARPYRNYLSWLVQRDRAASVEAWKQALVGVSEPTLLFAGASEGDGVGMGEYALTLSEESTTRLSCAASEIGVTLNTMVQASWGLVSSRLLARRDVVFGATVSGRPAELPGVETMVGLFINTVPVRVSVDPKNTVMQHLSTLQAEQADLLDHHYTGLTEIVEAAGDGAKFDTLVVFESYPIDREAIAESGSIDGLRLRGVHTSDGSHYPLTLVTTVDTQMQVRFKYRRDVIDEESVKALAQRFSRVMERMEEVDTKIGSIDILETSERARLTTMSSGPGVSPILLPDLLASAVERSPDSSALVCGSAEVSYRVLDSLSSRLARVLVGAGVEVDGFVGVALPRSVDSVVSVWGVAKSGGAVVPFDPGYPVERLERMVVDSGVRVGVTVREFVGLLPLGVEWIVLDDPAVVALLASVSGDPVSAVDRVGRLRAESAAYVVYTSGSTGVPKGVVVTQAGLANFAVEQRDRYGLTGESRTLHFASPSFDASMLELLLAVGASSTMVVAEASVFGGVELWELLVSERVSHAFVTPAALASVDPVGLVDLRVVVVGGEAWSPELLGRWAVERGVGGEVREFFNGYGPTETTIMSNISGALVAGDVVSIGAPIRGMSALVLDGGLQPVPIGVSGELYLAGMQLARGYHRRYGLTSERFVANPFGVDGSRMYRTGDMVRWIGDDRGEPISIEYVGRSDFQVKVRGFRIELGEIDAVVTSYPGVEFAVTVALSGEQGVAGATVLVSYVLPAVGSDLDVLEIRGWVKERLPRHMVPSQVVVLDELPLTPVGKLDRAALPEPAGVVREFRAPVSESERVVAGVFEDVLDVDRVGLDDDFFELGGNSLIATQAVARLRRVATSDVRVQWFFTDRTVEDLARRIDEFDSEATRSAGDALDILLPIRDHGDVAPVFCVHPMLGFAWPYAGLMSFLDEDRPIYGLQSPGLSMSEEVPTSIHEYAARYVVEVRRVRPTGPYHLLGWSLGGVIAHAMAAQLREAGDTVTLTMMDSVLHIERSEFEAELKSLLVPVGVIEEDESTPTVLSTEQATRAAAAIVQGPVGLTVGQVHSVYKSAVASPGQINDYKPARLDVPLLYFTAGRTHPEDVEAAAQWTDHVVEVREVVVDAAHEDMTGAEALALVGPILNEYLNTSDGRNG
ncbi:amino acid adenylation domain-containing protein [Rhodococcus sp. UYP9]|uniref:non-ribosomal peptide synthetase n=3 Tax=unclassified Rhodococcus (in: high G+C Gram-positive bacteria) TaxID=192944 RepID=UPI003393887E